MAVLQYPSASVAQQAIDQGQLFGAPVPGNPPGASTLFVVPTQSHVAPLDLADQFQRAAATKDEHEHGRASTATCSPSSPSRAAPNPPRVVSQSAWAPITRGGRGAARLAALGSGQ
jgi:hypothetical protein